MDVTTELNGVKYLIVEELATRKNEKRLTDKAKKHGAIYQGIKELKTGGFWSETYAILKVLVPEKNIVAYNEDDE